VSSGPHRLRACEIKFDAKEYQDEFQIENGADLKMGDVIYVWATLNLQQKSLLLTTKRGWWDTKVRRWDTTMSMGETWDHQDSLVSNEPVVEKSLDHNMVLAAFYDRPRPDGTPPLIQRATHTVKSVRRVQNMPLLAKFMLQERLLKEARSQVDTSLTTVYAWHGSSATSPTIIAEGLGLMPQFTSAAGFYGQGNYTAHQASYSHHQNYVHRSKDRKV